MKALEAFAMKLPGGVERGVACAGTAIESKTFRCGKKAFLLVRAVDGGTELRVKLGASQPEAKRRGHQVGAHGWTKVLVANGDKPDMALLKRFVAESHASCRA